MSELKRTNTFPAEYRAWNNHPQKKYQKMLYHEDLLDHVKLYPDGSCYVKNNGGSYHGILLWYIGQKDINNKKIYEGDLIQHSTAVCRGIYEVVFKNGRFQIQATLKDGTLLYGDEIGYIDNWKEWEVVGNVYEGVKKK